MASHSACSVVLFALLAGMAAAQGGSTPVTRVTPTEKVISLLEDLKAEVEADGTTEASSYDAFACFCKDTISSKSASIISGKDAIKSESSTIVLKTSNKEDKEKLKADREKKDQELNNELSNTKATYDKAKAEYQAEDADLSKAISSLENAIQSMEDSKPVPGVGGLLQITNEMTEQISFSLALADSMGLIATPAREKVTAFLQQSQGARVDPLDSGFKFHSQPIIKIMNDLKKDFTKTYTDLNADWGVTTRAYKRMVANLKKQIKINNQAMNNLDKVIGILKSTVAAARSRLLVDEADLKDDEAYLKDLIAQCEQRGKDWDQRAQLRSDEITALGNALTVLKDEVKPMDEAANARAALLQTPASSTSNVSTPVVSTPASKARAKADDSKVISFLQQGPLVRARATNLLQRGRVGTEQARKESAIALLAEASKRIHSTALASLVMRSSADPFAKIKTLIQELIERLLKEGEQEASKKGFCDTELGKAKTDRDFRYGQLNDLLAELESLEAKLDALAEEMTLLTNEIQTLEINLENATTLRNSQKAINLQTIEDANAGLTGIKKAIAIMQVFYRTAARKEVLLQYSPVQDDTAGAGFSGAYKGKQDSATGIIGLLEVIKSDFERTIKVTTNEEKEAAAEHVEFDRVSQSDIASKEMTKTLDQEDWTSTNNTIFEKYDDLQTTQDLLDKALKELVALNPMCVDSTMPYAERVAKREAEIDALNRALCLLDTNSLEQDCTTDTSGKRVPVTPAPAPTPR